MGEMGERAGDKNVVITYETLFDILRREKDREELQKLDASFYTDVVNYIREKKEALIAGQETLFSEEDRDKTEIQLQNIKRILKELYNRREKKIIDTAIMKSRTNSDIIDGSAMLDEEKMLFSEITKKLNCSRAGILFNILEGRTPESKKTAEDASEPARVSEGKEKKAEQKETKMVRFIHAVPQFYGEDAELYGPFDEEDIACLPREIAELLISKERADEIREEN
jgi:DNA replication initiation complex subunit (GINS family)